MRNLVCRAWALSLLMACAGAAPAADPPKPAGPEQVLAAKGLTRAGNLYLVETDAKLSDGLRAMRTAKKQEEEYKAKRAALEKQLKTAQATLSDWMAQFEKAHQEMEKTGKGDTRKYNRLVGQTNALQNRIREGEKLIAQKEKELEDLADPHHRYVSALHELSVKMEAAAKQYEALGSDADVKAALAKLNEKPGPKFRLGPSAVFAEELPRVRRQSGQIVSAPIKLTFDGGTPQTQVTLNGKVTERMTVDSGAASVVISWQTAEECGVPPGPGDPKVIMEVADGKRVEATKMVLDSVRVGPFVVRNVECTVLPKSAGKVSGLLGGTFLRHFVYKSDLAAGELHMTQLVETGPAAPEAAAPPEQKDTVVAAADGKGGFTVPASGAWVPVTFTVEAGKCYEVKARGTWTGSVGPVTGPEGHCPPEIFHVLGPQPYLKEQQKDRYLGQHPRNALVGRIGSEKWDFYVGAGCRFLAPVSGPLSFKMNDTASASPQRTGKMEVTISAIEPDWVDRKGQVEILARIDDQDRLHLTPTGMFWEWGGSWGKPGLHEGTWPTVVSGIYWWPRWSDPKLTDPLVAPGLWPRDWSKFEVTQVRAKRGGVEVADRGASEIVLRFSDQGLGSSQVGCLISTGNLPTVAPREPVRGGARPPARVPVRKPAAR